MTKFERSKEWWVAKAHAEMIELVSEPEVHIIAKTMIDSRGLRSWIEDYKLSHLLETETPLGSLTNDIATQGSSLDSLAEFGGRHCYRSWAKGRDSDAYIANILGDAHGSVLEHSWVTLAIGGVSRSLSHEIVRHRVGMAVSQESQRYVPAKDIRFVVPPLLVALDRDDDPLIHDFLRDCALSLARYTRLDNALRGSMDALMPHGVDFMDAPIDERGYLDLRPPKLATLPRKRILEAARAMLPNAAETRMVWSMNMRTARHLCELRGSDGADLEIRRLFCKITPIMKEIAPRIFHDFSVIDGVDGFPKTACDHHKV